MLGRGLKQGSCRPADRTTKNIEGTYMTIDKLIKALSIRIAQLLATKWTGKITICIEVNRGGISKTKIGIEEQLTFE